MQINTKIISNIMLSSLFLFSVATLIAQRDTFYQGVSMDGVELGYDPKNEGDLRIWIDPVHGVTLDTFLIPTVVEWKDQSSYQSHLFQATKANQPEWVSNQVNGLPVARFNGTTMFLQGTNASLFFTSGNDVPYSAFVVCRSQMNANENIYTWGNLTNTTGRTGLRASNSTFTTVHLRQDNNNVADNASFAGGARTNRFMVYGVVFSKGQISLNGECVIYVNRSTSPVTANEVGNMTLTSFSMGAYNRSGGAAQLFTGDIAELLIYGTNLNEISTRRVMNYLNAKYDLN